MTGTDRAQAPILVLGIGNRLLGDDGVGLAQLDLLRADLAGDPRVECVDGGTLGLMLVGLLEGRRALLLLDAVQRDDRPGKVHLERDAERVVAPRGFGAHGGNASELLVTARMLGVLPEHVQLVGVEPEEVRTRIGLSPAVRRALPAAHAMARVQLHELYGALRLEGGGDVHELSIAIEVLRTASSELARRGGGRLTSVTIAVGELSAVEPDLLAYAWEAVSAGGEHERARLAVEWIRAEQTCPTCGEVAERQPGTWLRLCPDCELPLRVEGGDVLELLEIEYEREPSLEEVLL